MSGFPGDQTEPEPTSIPLSTPSTDSSSANKNPTESTSFLDMVSADMDFEQAYSMYTTLQHKHAIASIEQLEKVQMLNQQYITNLPPQQSSAVLVPQQNQPQPQPQPHTQPSQLQHHIQHQPQLQPQHIDTSNSFPGNNQFSFNLTNAEQAVVEPPAVNPDTNYKYHRTQILSGRSQPKNSVDSPNYTAGAVANTSASPSYRMIKSNSESTYSKPRDEEEDDFDQFFSNTESNALDKFLDSLANPTAFKNPMDFYGDADRIIPATGGPQNDFNDLFDLHTMKAVPHPDGLRLQNKANTITPAASLDHENLRKELTEAFSQPHISRIDTSVLSPQNQLPTPSESRESSSSFLMNDMKRNVLITPPSNDESKDLGRFANANAEDLDQQVKKRRRSSTKPLLSLEQKRLNHSHSEQKRRQMCKLAYERCLRLIIDIDAFNKLPNETFEQRKSKRARINKDGLPNLSKHSALIRISNEITLILDFNQKLKSLLLQVGAKADVDDIEERRRNNIRTQSELMG